MAIYKNREVQISAYVTNDDPTVEIIHVDGVREMVKLREVQFTEVEKKNLSHDNTVSIDNVNVIKDKDLKDLKDSQDKEKIEAEQKKHPQNKDVPVSSIKVNADEVQKNRAK